MSVAIARDKSCFTPFGLWIKDNCRGSHRGPFGALSVTNLDYVIEDFGSRPRRIMLLEEKTFGVTLTYAQVETFKITDLMYRTAAPLLNPPYEYWGFYVLVMQSAEPGPGMKLNGQPITPEQLKDHIDFRRKHCEPWKW